MTFAEQAFAEARQQQGVEPTAVGTYPITPEDPLGMYGPQIMQAMVVSPKRVIEHDPSGLPLSAPGAKADAGKVLGGLLLDFAHALEIVAEVGTHGAGKYSRGGWLKVQDAQQRYLDAAMRHLLKLGKGEQNDKDSGLPHLGHAAWNLLAIIELNARSGE